jgi:hypothetical protein
LQRFHLGVYVGEKRVILVSELLLHLIKGVVDLIEAFLVFELHSQGYTLFNFLVFAVKRLSQPFQGFLDFYYINLVDKFGFEILDQLTFESLYKGLLLLNSYLKISLSLFNDLGYGGLS